ncbi:MAG: M28 family peptidase [Ferruginibacter sp.]
MSKIFFRLSSLAIITGFISCNNNSGSAVDDNDGIAAFNKDSLAQKIIMLSSDSFQGRRPFTLGETRTVDYISKTFAAMGLEPGNKGSWFQEVPMGEITSIGDPVMKVQSPKGNFDLKKMDDYVIGTELTDSIVSLNNDDVVFAGYGIIAPEYKWNDYAGLDVKGKVVIVLVNDPGYDGSGDTTIFKGKEMTYYGRWTYKYEEASRQGAKGCLIVHNTAAASYPFSVVQNSWSKARMILDNRGNQKYDCPVKGWITEDAAKKLLTAATNDTSLLVKAKEHGFKGMPLNLKLSTTLKVTSVFNKSKNVIAKITGSKRPDEYIIYTAHWDHFGIGKPDEKGDSIFNGALDNASGSASILEIARAFKSMKTKPERTIIFLAVTGEEQGLLGSSYYAQHPVYPVDKTVANINIDEINNVGPTKDVTIAGFGQSQLEDYLVKELKVKGRYVAPEQHPEGGHYFRSDHFSFAKVGVPALTVSAGTDDIKNGKAYGAKMADEYNEKHYHRPSDNYDAASWNLEGGLEDIILLFRVGRTLAFETTFPGWKEGSEFKKLRK